MNALALLKKAFLITTLPDDFLPKLAARLIWLLPIVIALLFCIGWYIPYTERFTIWLTLENRPVEILTFLFLIAGSILGFILFWHYKKNKEEIVVRTFVAAVSFGLFFVAMEEISWGQQFFHFKTPEALDEINKQHETTIHNIGELQGSSEYFHLFFGLSGIVGCCANLFKLNKVKVPDLLISWFVVIALIALSDLLVDAYSYNKQAQYFMRRFSEVNEMLIGVSGFLYTWILLRREKGFKKHNNPIEHRVVASQPLPVQHVL